MISALYNDRSHTRTKRNSGFVLIIVIVLVAFLVLLLVSFASLTRVETQVAINNQVEQQARENALFALNIALGQLQKYAGPDQRITATADLAGDAQGRTLPNGDPAQNTYSLDGTTQIGAVTTQRTIQNGLGSIQPGTRYWTGVWGNRHNPNDIYTKTPAPGLLTWLVSGNENGPSFTSDPSGNGKITPPATIPQRPALSTNLTSTSTGSDTSLTINGEPAALLVGPNTVASAATATNTDLDNYVVAKLVNITVPESTLPGFSATSSTPVTLGRYAWWVGDEGVKARYNIVDPYANKDKLSTGPQFLYRLMAPLHTGVELITPSSGSSNTYPAPTVTLQSTHEGLGRILTLDQAPLLTNGGTTQGFTNRYDLKKRFHSLSATSTGLLTDTLNGGLRQDLTYYFEKANSPGTLAGQKIIPGTESPLIGPMWDKLHSFYNVQPTGSGLGASITCQPETSTQIGIHPIITQFKILISIGPVSTITPGTPTLLSPRANVLFVLANPYNVTLNSPPGGVDFTITAPTSGPFSYNIASKFVINFIPDTNTLDTNDDGTRNYAGASTNSTYGIVRAVGSGGSEGLIDTVKFHLAGFSIPPGETIYASVGDTTQTANVGGAALANPINTINLCVGLPPSGTPADNYYRPSPSTWSVTVPVTTPTAVPGFNPRGIGGALALSVTMKDISGGILQQHDDFMLRTQGNVFSKLVASASLNIPINGTGFRLKGTQVAAGGAATRNFNGRIFQDYNLRGTRLHQANVGNNWGQISPVLLGWDILDKGGSAASTAFNGNLDYWAEGNVSLGTRTVTHNSVFYDLPQRVGDTPTLFSLGQLQHASLTTSDTDHGTWLQPGYAVGNSYHHPFVRRELSVQPRLNGSHTTALPLSLKNASTRYFDLSYLLNASLWDKYYFSTIPQSGASFTPLNPRYQLSLASTAADARQKDAAASLQVAGAFNVNSTSKDAWLALLGGLNNINTPTDSAAGAVFARSLWQPGNSVDPTHPTTTRADRGTGANAYQGVRRLSSAELATLADSIVQRVRARGPFVSLAQFVNRSLTPATTAFNPVINDAAVDSGGATGILCAGSAIPMGRGLSGTLQAAIDHSGRKPTGTILFGGLNDFSGSGITPAGAGADGDRDTYNPVSDTYNGFSAGNLYFADADRETSAYPVYTLAGAPGSFTNGSAQQVGLPGPNGRRSTAIPGWLLQGDILQSIGSVLSARSDTFVIRTYGEVRDPLNPAATTPRARAWCEAVVQRLPEYVNTADAATVAPSSFAATNPNQTFGRRFKVVSFRWLTPKDI